MRQKPLFEFGDCNKGLWVGLMWMGLDFGDLRIGVHCYRLASRIQVHITPLPLLMLCVNYTRPR